MKIIYEPKGKAREYAERAINLYGGCVHGCRYCYGAKLPWVSPHQYYETAKPKKDVIARLMDDVKGLDATTPEIHLSFTGDVYQPAEMQLHLTRKAIAVLVEHGLPFTILTKGGTRAMKDFDLLAGYDRASFGSTIVFTNQADADYWEPNAPSIVNRIEAVEQAHRRGIRTWISLEPVIDPDQALELIEYLNPIVDHWKVGKLNYHTDVESKVDWIKFTNDVEALFTEFGADYYLKHSLTSLRPHDLRPEPKFIAKEQVNMPRALKVAIMEHDRARAETRRRKVEEQLGI